MATPENAIRILVVEDNSEDFKILQVLFSKIGHHRYELRNAHSLYDALEILRQQEHDVYLVDYKLGPDSGMEFLQAAAAIRCAAPIILLTGHADHELDLKAMGLGASDFLNKNKLDPDLLERSVRYALEHKRSAENLRREQEFFKALIENSLEGITIVDQEGNIKYTSPASQKILGYTSEEAGTNGLFSFVHPDEATHVKEMLKYLFRTPGNMQTIETQVRHKNGTWRVIEALAKSHFFKNPDFLGVVVNYRDVTERKKADRATSRLATIVESSEDAIYSVTLDGVVVSWNPGAQRIYGFTPEEIGGRDLSLVIPSSNRDEFSRFLETVRDGRAVTNVVAHQNTKKGKHLLLSLTLSPIKNALGQVVSASIIARDITESEKAKAIKEMLQAERDQLLERLQLQMERMPIACILSDQNFNYTYWNPAAEKMFGYSFGEVEGRSGLLISPNNMSSAGEEFRSAVKNGGGFQARVLDTIRKDGQVICCEWYGTPLPDADGNFSGMMAMAINVTERRKAEEVSSQLAAILQQTTDAVIGSDLEGNIFSWNRGAENMLGYGLSEIVGQNTAILVPPDRKEEMENVRDLATKDENVSNYETVLSKKNGDLVDVSVTVSPIKDTKGKIIGVSAITRDISDRKKAEESLRKHEEQMRMAQKMDAIGRLAGGVAHDFNNLLSVIGGNAEFLLSTLSKDDPHREEVEEIQKAVHRGADLTKQLLVFGQKQISQPQPLLLNDLASEMNKMLKRLIDASIDLSIIQDVKLRPILADPGQMQQVILNLVLNARDAMPQGGHLILETKNCEAEDLVTEHRSTLPPGAYARLTVTDTGMGMTPEIQSRIFEPFFTTKAGKGTGLGLATVYGIVTKWSGHIFVHSTPGMGTTFSLYFPVLLATEAKAPKPKQMPLLGEGTETILLAEDEEPVRKILVRTLKKYGYKVIDAANGIEAVQRAWNHPGTIHLLLTDTVMPKMNGKELADELRKARPKVKVIFISGYPREILSQQGIMDPEIHLIQKPFELEDLASQIRKILDEK